MSNETDEIKDQPNVEQCEVVDSDKEKLKDHIRMVHKKGHHTGKQVPKHLLGGQHGQEQGRQDGDVQLEEEATEA